MDFFPELRAFADGPLGRREARAAASLPRMIARYALAGGLDVTAILALLVRLGLAGAEPEWPNIVLLIVAALLALLPVMEAVGFAATAIAGDRAADTLEALVMTPMDRREIVWAKLLGRTAPVRQFMLAAAPAYLACGAAMFAAMLMSKREPFEPLLMLVAVAIGMAAAAAWWALIFLQAHCLAAAALYCSARIRAPWLAALAAYALAFGPQLALTATCCFAMLAPAYPFVIGPLLFDALVKNFDAYALGEPVSAFASRFHPAYRLPPPPRRLH